MKSRLIKTLLILLTWLAIISVAVLALGSNPPLFFTANTTAPGPSPTQTTMEQALLQRLNNAATSIDAAFYSLNRVSIRDALIAAHSRVVADDEAYNQAAYNADFAALQTAGIPLVLDNRTSLMHNKFLVIDGDLVWSGSTNLTGTGFTYHHNHSYTEFRMKPKLSIFARPPSIPPAGGEDYSSPKRGEAGRGEKSYDFKLFLV